MRASLLPTNLNSYVQNLALNYTQASQNKQDRVPSNFVPSQHIRSHVPSNVTSQRSFGR